MHRDVRRRTTTYLVVVIVRRRTTLMQINAYHGNENCLTPTPGYHGDGVRKF